MRKLNVCHKEIPALTTQKRISRYGLPTTFNGRDDIRFQPGPLTKERKNMKSIFIAVMLMFAALAMPVQADDFEGFAPIDHHAYATGIGAGASNAIASEESMIASHGPTLFMVVAPTLDKVTNSTVGSSSGDAPSMALIPYEIGWRS